MSESNSWSNDLINAESNSWSNVESIDNVDDVDNVDNVDSDINLGIWIVIPLSVIIVFLVGAHNYDPRKKEEEEEHNSPP